eukprot:10957076-Alexandrium_andersonii.AAC.1
MRAKVRLDGTVLPARPQGKLPCPGLGLSRCRVPPLAFSTEASSFKVRVVPRLGRNWFAFVFVGHRPVLVDSWSLPRFSQGLFGADVVRPCDLLLGVTHNLLRAYWPSYGFPDYGLADRTSRWVPLLRSPACFIVAIALSAQNYI